MASNNDMRAHQETWEGVKSLLFWGTAASLVVGFLVILIIAT